MRILVVVILMFVFSVAAYKYKNKFRLKIKLAEEIISYVEFYETNISFYKENLYKINSRFNIMQENKNAKNICLQLNNNIYLLNNKILFKTFDSGCCDIINKYFSEIGQSDYCYEKDKSDNILKFLTKLKNEAKEDLKTKGEMWFKIILMIGVLISIIIW